MTTPLSTATLTKQLIDAHVPIPAAKSLANMIARNVGKYNDTLADLAYAIMQVKQDCERALNMLAADTAVSPNGLFNQTAADANRLAAASRHLADEIMANANLLRSFGIEITAAELIAMDTL